MQPANTKNSLLAIFCLFCLGLRAQENFTLKFKNSEIYSGIEVGSKGVKMSILEVSQGEQKATSFNILKDTSINSDFISFNNTSFHATLDALVTMYDIAFLRYSIPSNKIFTVFSSGVKVQAGKEEKENWLTILADSFRMRIYEPERKMDAISVLQEARLSHLGIVPENRRYTSFLIDIGSGNTKGGYFPNGNTKDFKLFQLTWGTRSVVNGTEKRLDNDKTLLNYRRQLDRLLSAQPEEEIVYAINVSGAYNMSDNIAFSGGIAWSLATLMFPQLWENPVIPITYDELVEFNEKIYSNFASLSADAMVKTANSSSEKNAIAKEVRRVNAVFDQQSLLAGTGLLLKIMRQFEGIYEKKQFYLIKNGQVGWISAYVDQTTPKIQP